MDKYALPLRDIDFLLRHVFDAGQVLQKIGSPVDLDTCIAIAFRHRQAAARPQGHTAPASIRRTPDPRAAYAGAVPYLEAWGLAS
jgi:hypothetical protein